MGLQFSWPVYDFEADLSIKVFDLDRLTDDDFLGGAVLKVCLFPIEIPAVAVS